MGVRLYFHDGPRNGQYREYDGELPPKTVGCVAEAHALGMHGYYKRMPMTQEEAPGILATVMGWLDLSHEIKPDRPSRRGKRNDGMLPPDDE